MKRNSLIFIVSLLLFFSNLAFGSDIKGIAYVNLQKAAEMSDAGKKVKESFSQKVEKARDVVEAKQKELKKLKDSIETKSLILSEEAKKEKEREFQKEVRDYQRFIKDSQEELKREEAEISKRIINELREVIEKIGKERNYTLIFEKSRSGILYASNAVDITDEVVKIYNEQTNRKNK